MIFPEVRTYQPDSFEDFRGELFTVFKQEYNELIFNHDPGFEQLDEFFVNHPNMVNCNIFSLLATMTPALETACADLESVYFLCEQSLNIKLHLYQVYSVLRNMYSNVLYQNCRANLVAQFRHSRKLCLGHMDYALYPECFFNDETLDINVQDSDVSDYFSDEE